MFQSSKILLLQKNTFIFSLAPSRCSRRFWEMGDLLSSFPVIPTNLKCLQPQMPPTSNTSLVPTSNASPSWLQCPISSLPSQIPFSLPLRSSNSCLLMDGVSYFFTICPPSSESSRVLCTMGRKCLNPAHLVIALCTCVPFPWACKWASKWDNEQMSKQMSKWARKWQS